MKRKRDARTALVFICLLWAPAAILVLVKVLG